MTTLSSAGAMVVVADDDTLVRMVMRRALCERGFRVVETADGITAVEAVARHNADLLIIDAHMPGMSLSETLASVEGLVNAPAVIVISGDPHTPLSATGTFLVKPFELDPFLSTVDLLLTRRKDMT